MIESYRDVLRHYATFSGRTGRAGYWWFVLANFIITFALYLPALIAGSLGGSNPATSLLAIPVALYGLALLIPSIALSVRRLHDIGASGWWYLLIFVPVIGGLALLIMHVMASQPANNRYGPTHASAAVTT